MYCSRIDRVYLIIFSALYLSYYVTCQKMRTRLCNLTIKDSKNANLKVPAARNERRRKLVASKIHESQKPLDCQVNF